VYHTIFAASLAVLLGTTALHGQASKCLPADSTSAGLIADLRRIVTATDAWTVEGRDNIFHIPVVPPASITLVTDSKVCAKASSAYGPPPGSTVTPQVYVIALGTAGYAVQRAIQPGDAHSTQKIFDRKWSKVGGRSG
jgi:hypothetical protein